jgi:hypothetical protein
MLPQFYQKCLENLLSPSQYITLQILVWLLQAQKTVQIEKLAALLSLPVKYESRRRHLQRFLVLPKLSVKLLWFPLLKKWLKIHHHKGKRLKVVIDRTQWKKRNLFVVSLIWERRSLPLYWRLLNKQGSSNFNEQKQLLNPIFSLLKGYQIIVLGDREFGHVRLADWLSHKGVGYVLRTKEDKYYQQPGQDYRLLSTLGLAPGHAFYLKGINLTKQKGFGGFNLGGYWSKKSAKNGASEGWYLLTNLDSLEKAVKAYQARYGIEAMFKDCKSGGYNLEKCQAKDERLISLVLVITIAYSCAIFRGRKLKAMGVQKYICRLREADRLPRRHSTFWVGLYGQLWVSGWDFCQELVESLMRLNPNKLPFYQRGLRAKRLIQSTL